MKNDLCKRLNKLPLTDAHQSLAAPRKTQDALNLILSSPLHTPRDKAERAVTALINALWPSLGELPPSPIQISDWFEADRVRIAAKGRQLRGIVWAAA